MKIKSFIPTALLIIVVAAAAYALGNKGLPIELQLIDSKTSSSPANVHEQNRPDQSIETVKSNILSNIQKLDDAVNDIQIEESPVSGVYWVLLPGNETLLVSEDGRYLLGRVLSEFQGERIEPVSSSVVEMAKAKVMEEVSDDFKNTLETQLIFQAKGEEKGEIYVFTDVNCGYCRKFHKDVPELNNAGIAVHYFAGPFFSKDREVLEKIWCSEAPLQAMTQAKEGQKPTNVSVSERCRQIVTAHMALGQKLGIRGTPALFTKDGEQLGGYVPPAQLINRLTAN